ncbi:polycystic kidney disease protein 1-like 2 isoform X2 [Pomacea canaliculata]|nr:polycystic kidney disease protein 1-like 2 isoform X2 [Pomacea canaliculata]
MTLPVVLASMWNKVPKRRVNVTELPEPLYIFLQTNYTEREKRLWESTTFSLEHSEKEIVVKAFRDRSTIVNFTFTPSNVSVSVQVILQRGNISNTTVYNESEFPLPESKWKVLRHVVQEPSSLLLPSQDDANEEDTYRIKVNHNNSSQPTVVPVVKVVTAEISCKTWDTNASAWKNSGCKVANVSNFDEVVCECTHLSIFTATFFVSPNVLSTDDLRLFAEFFHNPVMVTVVVLLWMTYLVGLYWAYHADSLDKAQRGIAVLEDNSKDDEHLYLVCTVTGWGRNTGTTSNVYIYLSGTAAKTRVHRLADAERDIFFSGAENWFLISSPHDLGDLTSVIIWHDNTGSSPDWFLNEVYVREVDGDQAWHCLYNNWLSVYRGVLCVEVPATSAEEMAKHRFYHFVINTSQSLRTEHLWLSFVTKPNYSTFMRMHRLTCALCILLTMMMASLMFHGLPTDDPRIRSAPGPSPSTSRTSSSVCRHRLSSSPSTCCWWSCFAGRAHLVIPTRPLPLARTTAPPRAATSPRRTRIQTRTPMSRRYM